MYEVLAAYVFVYVYMLVDGELCESDRPVTKSSRITHFEFSEVLPESERMKAAYKYGEDSPYYDEMNGLRNYVAEFALRLKKFGKDLLLGDFSVMPKMDKLIRDRASQQSPAS